MMEGTSQAFVPMYLPKELSTFMGLKKTSLKMKFTPEEDAKLAKLVAMHGSKDWSKIAMHMGTRNSRQCRERWNNYVNPALRTEPWTDEEDRILQEKYNEYGARWNKIAKFFKNRGDNNIRNRYMMIKRRQMKGMKPPPQIPQEMKEKETEPPEQIIPVFDDLSNVFEVTELWNLF